jgi:predicted ATP-binding protein involved in virulence
MSNEQEIKTEVLTVTETAKQMLVASSEQYQGAAEYLKAVKAAQKKVADHFGPMKEAAHKAWKTITAQEAATLAPLTEAEGTLKRNMLAYQQAQEAIRQAEQRRLQAEADARAKAERDRAEAAAAKQRAIEAEQRRIAEAAQRAAEQASAADRARLQAEAAAAQRKADSAAEKAMAKDDQAAAVIATVVTVAASVPVVQGQTIRKTWKARVVNAAAVPREWLTINQQALDAFAKSTKGAVPVAGVEMYEETGLASSSK